MSSQPSTSPSVAKKIRSYLEDLSPGARQLLVRGIETARSRGDNDPHLEIILAVARTAGQPDKTPEGVEEAFRKAFYAPLLPFRIAETLAVRQPGRIREASLAPIWTWLRRDVARDAIAAALGEISETLEPLGDAAARRAADLRAVVLPLARRHIEQFSGDEDGLQRLAGQLGDKKVLEDVRDVLDVFQHADALESVMWSAPAELDDDQEAPLRQQLAAIKAFADKYPCQLHLLAVRYLERASTAAVLVRLARLLARTDNAQVIEKSLYKPFVDVAISEVERMVELVRARRGLADRRGTLAEALLQLHRTVRRIQIAVDVEGMTEWGRRLSHCRRDTSELLRDLIEGTPGLVKRALRPRTVGDRVAGPTEDTVQGARDALEVLRAARKAIDSLALNELVTRSRVQVEQVIDNSSKGLIDRLRDAPSQERAALAEIVEAAIEFARIVFDEDYAALMRRSLHVATTKPTLKTAG